MTSTVLNRPETAPKTPINFETYPPVAPAKLRLDHFDKMLTDIGIWQHSAGPQPDRRHGYSIDDQVRGLIVAINYFQAGVETKFMERLGRVCFDFVKNAAITSGPNAGRFHNFCDEHYHWLDKIGSDDSLGRTIWALGVACSADVPFAPREEAMPLLSRAMRVAEKLSPARTVAFSILGTPTDHSELVGNLADRLVLSFRDSATDDWAWFENHLTYCNARLPQALFAAADRFPERPEYLAVARRSLAFLLRVSQNEKGSYSPIGNEPLTSRGWYTRGDERPPLFDQQPVDAGALVECCALAYAVTGNPTYRHAAHSAYGWYFGANVHGISVYHPDHGGVADAITPSGISDNMGAESVISIHLAHQALSAIG